MLPESIIDRIKGMLANRLNDRSPVWVDIFQKSEFELATTYAQTLKSDIDCGQFALALLYGEATFGASADKDIYVDLRARPPGKSDYSLEPFARMILAFNTTTPYKRYYWLPIDIRYVDMLSIYVSQTGAAAASTINHLSLRLVV